MSDLIKAPNGRNLNAKQHAKLDRMAEGLDPEATSVYTIRIERDQLSVEMQQIIEQVAAALPNVVVSGVSSVSFRTATNDAAALQIAQKATGPVAFWATFRLTTGRGVHRREVTYKSVRMHGATPSTEHQRRTERDLVEG